MLFHPLAIHNTCASAPYAKQQKLTMLDCWHLERAIANKDLGCICLWRMRCRILALGWISATVEYEGRSTDLKPACLETIKVVALDAVSFTACLQRCSLAFPDHSELGYHKFVVLVGLLLHCNFIHPRGSACSPTESSGLGCIGSQNERARSTSCYWDAVPRLQDCKESLSFYRWHQ